MHEVALLSSVRHSLIARQLTRNPSTVSKMTKTHVTNIAIVGATGTVGKYITKSLLETGKHTVTAITRADSTATIPDGVKVAKIDYNDHSSLVDSLKGQEALIISLSVMSPRDTQTKLIDAAADAGVAWIMPNEYSPNFGSQVEMGKDALIGPSIIATRQHIENLGVSSWVGLTCSFWYQFCLVNALAYGFEIPKKTVTFFDDGEQKITHSTLPQCGRAVAALFSLPIEGSDPCLSQWKNKECYTASFTLSQRDILDVILRVTGDRELDWTIQHQPAVERYQSALQMMKDGDRSGFLIAMNTRVWYKDGGGDLTGKLENEKLGLPEEDVQEATREAVETVLEGGVYGKSQS